MHCCGRRFAVTSIAFIAGFVTDSAWSATAAYYVAMRAPDVEPAPRFVRASQAETPDMAISLGGCDGRIYWFTSRDASAVQAALKNGNTVQLVLVPTGSPPKQGAAVCLFQPGN